MSLTLEHKLSKCSLSSGNRRRLIQMLLLSTLRIFFGVHNDLTHEIRKQKRDQIPIAPLIQEPFPNLSYPAVLTRNIRQVACGLLHVGHRDLGSRKSLERSLCAGIERISRAAIEVC